MDPRNTEPPRTHFPELGFSWPILIALAALAAPRVVLHDLGVISEETFVNALFVFVPPLIWVGAIVWKRVPNPFITGLVIGLLHAVMLAVIHQVTWAQTWDGDAPTDLPEILVRGFAFGSSLFAGTLIGVVTGTVAWLVSRAVPARRR